MTAVFVCGETIIFAPEPSDFTWEPESVKAKNFWFARRGIAVGVHPR